MGSTQKDFNEQTTAASIAEELGCEEEWEENEGYQEKSKERKKESSPAHVRPLRCLPWFNISNEDERE